MPPVEVKGRPVDWPQKYTLLPKLTQNLVRPAPPFDPSQKHVIGILEGEGVGPEVVAVALRLLGVLQQRSSRRLDLQHGGLIGYPAKAISGRSLSPEVVDFATQIFAENGALFCGPGGERFVYEMRQTFDLYCKFTPLEPLPELRAAGAVRPEVTSATDIIAVRENMGGIYQGNWSSTQDDPAGRMATHQFHYTQAMVERILIVAMRLASQRRHRVHLVLKPGGIPSISDLWRDCAEALSSQFGVDLFELEIDNAVYQLIANPAQFDVVVSPNMFGDVLADCGSLLLASRGLSYSGNFNDCGNAVYQTGHGAARDIAGKGIANPIGQTLSLGMMLRESFDWPEADAALRLAVRATLAQGLCTSDIAMPGHQIVGTAAFGEAMAAHLDAILEAMTI